MFFVLMMSQHVGDNSFNVVRINLVSHDSDCVTDKDILLARKIQQLATVYQD